MKTISEIHDMIQRTQIEPTDDTISDVLDICEALLDQIKKLDAKVARQSIPLPAARS